MTLEQLRIFAAVAEQLHVTRAATKLRLTQSAASAAIAAIERRYATKLFLRVGRTIKLTDAGEVLLTAARVVLRDAADAERALEEMSGLKRGRIRIYASQTIANYWLPKRLLQFNSIYPQIALLLTIGNSAQVEKAMIEGEADLGLVEGDAGTSVLRPESIPGDQLVLVVGTQHPWFKRRHLDPSELGATKWVLREPGSGTRQVFESAARAMGVDPATLDVVMEFPSNEAVRSAVEAGAGATVLSDLVVASSLRYRALRAIGLPLPQRDFTVLSHPERYQSKAQSAFLKMILAERVIAAAGLSAVHSAEA